MPLMQKLWPLYSYRDYLKPSNGQSNILNWHLRGIRLIPNTAYFCLFSIGTTSFDCVIRTYDLSLKKKQRYHWVTVIQGKILPWLSSDMIFFHGRRTQDLNLQSLSLGQWRPILWLFLLFSHSYEKYRINFNYISWEKNIEAVHRIRTQDWRMIGADRQIQWAILQNNGST